MPLQAVQTSGNDKFPIEGKVSVLWNGEINRDGSSLLLGVLRYLEVTINDAIEPEPLREKGR